MLYALTPHPVFQALGIRRAPIGGYDVFCRVIGDDVQVVRVLSDLEALEGKLQAAKSYQQSLRKHCVFGGFASLAIYITTAGSSS